MEDVSGGKGDDPEADDEAADGEDPAAQVPVIGGETGGFAGGEDLTTDTDGDEESADNKREPCHGSPLYLNLDGTWKGEMPFPVKNVLDEPGCKHRYGRR